MEKTVEINQETRRRFLKKVSYAAPAILALGSLSPLSAGQGQGGQNIPGGYDLGTQGNGQMNSYGPPSNFRLGNPNV